MRTTGTGLILAALLGLSAVGRAPAQETLLSRMVRSQNRWLRIAVVDGRISLLWTRLVQMNTSSSTDGSVKESFQLGNLNGRLQLSYQRTAADELLKVSVSGNGDTVAISRVPRGNSSADTVEFRQVPQEKITFSVGEGDRKQTFSADELWILLIVRREESRRHIIPLLEMLRSDWKLSETAAEIEEILVKGADAEVIRRRTRWAALVEQLGDERFAKREAADRALRADGPAVIGYLRQLEFDRLDAEQRFRVRRIMEALDEDDKDDSAAEVAARMAGDPAVWLALLARPEADTRNTAAKQLTLLLGGPIDVDPAADPETQKQQRERLRARIAPP